MNKVCSVCEKNKVMFSWESMCWKCQRDSNLRETQAAIRAGEEDADTFSSDYVICPYCGEALETDYGYEDFPEIYEEGDHVITCPECDKDFILETNISYSYETRRKEEQ